MAFIDLTTVAAVNGFLMQDAATDSALIQQQITDLSRYILNRTGRRYLGGFLSYTERYNGNGSSTLMLRDYPVLSVASLYVNGIPIQPSPDGLQAGFVINPSGSMAAVSIIDGSCWNTLPGWGFSNGNAPPLGVSSYKFLEGINNVNITYTAGQVTTQYYEAATVPATAPYSVTVQNAKTFWADAGVMLADGTTTTLYSVSNGVYTFDASLAGLGVMISYQYGAVPEDLFEAATKMAAVYYRRLKYSDQTSQIQPGVGTTAFSQAEWPADVIAIVDRYRRRFLD